MLRSALPAALFLLAAAGPPVSQVTVKPGESVILTRVGDRLAVVSRSEAPPISQMELHAAREMGMNPIQGPAFLPPVGMPETPGALAPPIRPGEVRVTFRLIPMRSAIDEQAILTVNNGLDSSFRFTAVMHQGAKSTPTDVCEVHAGKHGIEHWPYRIDRLDLNDLRLEPDGNVTRCQ